MLFMQDIYSLSYELKRAIEEDPRIIHLNRIEKEMNENEEVMALTYKKDRANDDYSDALNHFKEDNPIVIETQKRFYETKKNLESHPVVREYLSAYQQVRILYEEINKLLFSILNRNLCEDNK